VTRHKFKELRPESYRHPLDRQALMNLEKMPGLSLLLKKINEYSIDRLVRLQVQGEDFRVTSANFPALHQALLEAVAILDVSPVPELYLHRGTGHIVSYAIGVEQPSIGVNLEAMEWLSHDELLFLLGHELARVKSGYLAYQQLSIVMPMLKSVLSTTTFGLGGLAANGVEVALYNWIVMSKFTSDRAGLLACQNLDSAISTLMKLSGLPNEYLNKQTIDAFEAQARQFDTNSIGNLDSRSGRLNQRITEIVSFMNYQSPWGVMRASQLLEWADSGEYSRLLEFSS
jgi:Zn-dependent protease with chaperone function